MKKYAQNKDLISTKLDEELIMLDIDQGKYFGLNPVAVRIWELIESPKSLDELCEALLQEYEVSPALCQQDTAVHLEEMIRMNLISQV
ncbi:MAG: PqqD family protein [Bacteroidetes bacterium]|nr:MAG: PqqD family protein [Bacteroidota bacterium]